MNRKIVGWTICIFLLLAIVGIGYLAGYAGLTENASDTVLVVLELLGALYLAKMLATRGSLRGRNLPLVLSTSFPVAGAMIVGYLLGPWWFVISGVILFIPGAAFMSHYAMRDPWLFLGRLMGNTEAEFRDAVPPKGAGRSNELPLEVLSFSMGELTVVPFAFERWGAGFVEGAAGFENDSCVCINYFHNRHRYSTLTHYTQHMSRRQGRYGPAYAEALRPDLAKWVREIYLQWPALKNPETTWKSNWHGLMHDHTEFFRIEDDDWAEKSRRSSESERLTSIPPDKWTLTDRIRAAFRGIQRPAADSIAPHPCRECDELRNTFSRYSWDRLPEHVVNAWYDKLPLLSDDAFRYYLPAYLLVASASEDESDTVSEFVLYALASRGTDFANRCNRLVGYNEEQLGVLAAFLDRVESKDEYGDLKDEIAAARKNIDEVSGKGEPA